MSELTTAIKLKLITQPFLKKTIIFNLNGFLLNYNNKNYLISVHHNLPIKSICTHDDEELRIKINSCWSEILIIEPTSKILLNNMIYKTIQNKIPKYDDLTKTLIIKTYDNDIEGQFMGIEYIPWDNIDTSSKIPYIKMHIGEDSTEPQSGMSGSPVFFNDKLIGVFSKYNKEDRIAYIIPIYIIIKNICRTDNSNIYSLNIPCITKINSFLVKNELIYHPTFKMDILLESYMLIECDLSNSYNVITETKTSSENIMCTINLRNNFNYVDIITRNKDSEYQITSRLLSIMKYSYRTGSPILLFLLTKKGAFFSLNSNKLKIIS